MVRVILHMGFPKTGTTSLQSVLAAEKDRLAEAGILYPRAPREARNHHVIQAVGGTGDASNLMKWSVSAHGGVEQLKSAAERWTRSVEEEVRRGKPRLVVISSEVILAPVVPERLAWIAAWLRGFADEIEPVLYVRDPVGSFVSQMQEAAKFKGDNVRPGIDRPRRAIELAEDVFGKVTLLPFDRDRLIGGDIVTDFHSRFLAGLLPSPLPDRHDANVSLSAEAMVLAAMVNRVLGAEHIAENRIAHGKFVRMLRDADRKLPPTNGKIVLKPGIAQQIATASVDYQWLAESRGLTFPGLDGLVFDAAMPPFLRDFRSIADLVEIDDRRLGMLAGLLSEAAPGQSDYLGRSVTGGLGLFRDVDGLHLQAHRWRRRIGTTRLPRVLRAWLG